MSGTSHGVIAACLLALAMASTCSVALAGASPLGGNGVLCEYDTKDYTCPYYATCPQAMPKCYFTDLLQNDCACQ